MAIIVPYLSREDILRVIVGQDSFTPNSVLRLFTNNLFPTPDTVLSDLVECVVDGYLPISLYGGFGGYYITTVNMVSYAQYNRELFVSANEKSDVYGFYITDDVQTKLIQVERFPNAPITIGTCSLRITPRFVLA